MAGRGEMPLEYVYLLVLSCFFPLLFAFDRRIGVLRFWKAFLFSFLLAGIPFLIHDILSTGFLWDFNHEHISGIFIANIPIEEALFFLIIPFCCLFFYEISLFFFREKELKGIPPVAAVAGTVLVFLGIYFYELAYTSFAFLSSGLAVLLMWSKDRKILSMLGFWSFLLLSFAGFLLVNFVLTSLPVVIYNEQQLVGIRILTIPVEDFFYNLSLLSLYIVAYRYGKKKFHQEA